MPLLTHRSELHSITQLPQNHCCYLATKSLISQARHASPFRSVQIQHSPDETNHTSVLHGLSRRKTRNLVSNGSRTHPNARSMFWFLLNISPRILNPHIGFWTHTLPWRPCICHSTKPKNLERIWPHTRHPRTKELHQPSSDVIHKIICWR